jgi:hypothetical protein
MPYIICVNRPGYMPEADPVAVITLEEARAAAWALVFDSKSQHIDGSEVDALPESGGTIGPLPDGYVIEVQQVSFHELALAAGHEHPPARNEVCMPEDQVRVLDAYNGV